MQISVIMPVYQTDEFVVDALQSIEQQTLAATEIIVVDDGSDDGTAERIEALNIAKLKLIHQSNQGPAAARNTGIKACQGDFITFLDVDDLWLPNKLEVQSDLLLRNPSAALAMGFSEGFGTAPDNNEPRSYPANWSARLLLQLGALLVRKETFSQVGLFQEDLRQGEDVDWYLRVQNAGLDIVEHNHPVLRYRRHQDNVTNNTQARDSGFLKALKYNIDRKRSQPS